VLVVVLGFLVAVDAFVSGCSSTEACGVATEKTIYRITTVLGSGICYRIVDDIIIVLKFVALGGTRCVVPMVVHGFVRRCSSPRNCSVSSKMMAAASDITSVSVRISHIAIWAKKLDVVHAVVMFSTLVSSRTARESSSISARTIRRILVAEMAVNTMVMGTCC
jgi:hypothetical protein